jgi:DNA-directed RNA polymerase I subunit RPA2
VPLLLRALLTASDRLIFESIVGNTNNISSSATSATSAHNTAFVAAQVEAMLTDFNTNNPSLTTTNSCLKYLGRLFRGAIGLGSHYSDKAVGTELLRRFFFVHLNASRDKFNLAAFMAQKLYAVAGGMAKCDNADSLDSQELLLPGHLYLAYLKEKLNESLVKIATQMVREARKKPNQVDWRDAKYFRKVSGCEPSPHI